VPELAQFPSRTSQISTTPSWYFGCFATNAATGCHRHRPPPQNSPVPSCSQRSLRHPSHRPARRSVHPSSSRNYPAASGSANRLHSARSIRNCNAAPSQVFAQQRLPQFTISLNCHTSKFKAWSNKCYYPRGCYLVSAPFRRRAVQLANCNGGLKTCRLGNILDRAKAPKCHICRLSIWQTVFRQS